MYKQLFTLRGHSQAITSLAQYHHDKWFLVSGDNKGSLMLWNLTTRRPIITWKGHEDHILHIKQWHNFVITQSRDSSIRIWKFNFKASPPVAEEVFYLPINSLNFCNFETFQNYLFIPASVDSNNFDCYKIDPVNFNFTRVITNFNAFKLIYHEIIDSSGRNDFGIIMKIAYVEANDTLVLGFESGDIIALKINWHSQDISSIDSISSGSAPTISKDLESNTSGDASHNMSNGIDQPSQKPENKNYDRLVINKDPSLTVLYHNSSHSPNPITSLVNYDGSIISGSTNNKIIIHDIEQDTFQVTKVGNSGIQSIVKFNDQIILGYWSGVIESRNTTSQLFTILRATPSVTSAETPTSSIKLTAMCIIYADETNSTATSYKQLIQQKQRSVYNKTILFAGYEDGAIAAFSLQ